MKRLLSLILTTALISTLPGCDNSDQGSSNSNDLNNQNNSAINSPNSGNSVTDPGGQASQEDSGSNSQNGSELTVLSDGRHKLFVPGGCSTADGYYSMQEYLDSGDGCMRITYIDYASGQEVILCSDSSCSHNSERCSSFVTGAPHESTLFFWDNRLYYFEASYDREGNFSAGGWTGSDGEPRYDTILSTPAKLYRMNPDGTNRELVYAFPENLTVELVVVGDKNGLWFIQKEVVIERDEKTGAAHIGAKNKALVKLDLSEKKIVEQIPVPMNDNIGKDFIGVFGSKFIFQGTAYPDGKSAAEFIDILAPRPTMAEEIAHRAEYNALMAKCEDVFFALDMTDKTMTEIFRMGFDWFSPDLIGDRIYFPTTTSTFSLDLNTGKTEDFPVPDGYELEGFIGERPLFIMTGEPYKRVFIDPETGEMFSWILGSGTSFVIEICGDFALVISEQIGTPTPSGGLRNPYNQYALISLDDLYHGRKNFRKIDMLERYTR